MPRTLERYVSDNPSCSLLRPDVLAGPLHAPPYVAVLNDVYMIGPLTVHHRNGKLCSVNLEKCLVSSDFASSTARNQSKAAFEQACSLKRQGRFLALHGLRASNFWHWTMQALTQVVVAQAAGFNGTYILPSAARTHSFILESLSMLGVNPEQTAIDDGRGWHLEALYVPEVIQVDYGLGCHPAVLSRLRDILLNASGKSSINAERVYIARDHSNPSRRVINEIELLDVLFRYGFQRIVMEGLSLAEQIRLMAGARCLVGPHGAGMVHTLFIQPKSLVLELFAPDYINPCMLPAMDLLQHRYFMFANHWSQRNDEGHIHANIDLLDFTLRREFVTSCSTTP